MGTRANTTGNNVDEAKMEECVQAWLDKNKTWFQLYAIENLDLNTVEKWLRTNGKRICRCIKQLDNQQQNQHQQYGTTRCVAAMSPKRNSISIPVVDNVKIIKDANEYTATTIGNKTGLDLITTSSSTNDNHQRLVLHDRKICSACVIHNRKSSHLVHNESNHHHNHHHHHHHLHLHHPNKFSFVEELKSDSEGETNDHEAAPFAANRQLSAPSSTTLSNRLKLNANHVNNNNHPGLNNNNNNNNSNTTVSSTGSASMRKYHSFHSADTSNSLNALKFLIKSKIKIPHTFNLITVPEKMRLKANSDKSQEFNVLLELIKDISNELDLKRLSEKIISNVKVLLNADKASLFFSCRHRKKLASFKYDPHTGNRNSTIYSARNSSLSSDFELEIPFDETILGNVALTGIPINIANIAKEPNYDTSMDKLIGYQVKSLLCMPIKSANNEVIAVVQAINKYSLYDGSTTIVSFNENDIRLLNDYLQFCAISISNAQLFDFYTYECERNRSLIEVLHDLFEQQTNLDTILFRIMQRAQTLLKCQRCSILLNMSADEQDAENGAAERYSGRKAFDLFQSGNKPGQRRHSVEDDDGTKISKDLADYVISTGQKINLEDAYSDPRFDPLVDTVWKFKTKGILCMPIRNRHGNIIGCASIANRLDNQPFDENDEELFEAFCIFCGLGINNTLIYNKLEKSMAEKVVALEVLSYHATCSKNEIASFAGKYPNEDNYYLINKLVQRESLRSYLFDDFVLDNDEMVIASYEMFKHSGLMKIFHIEKQTLFQWLLTVRKNYRNIEYHNWRHAFNVCQNMFAIFENSELSNHLQDIEKLALLVGALCHDLDHRGTNNMFQVESHSPLFQLYGTTGILEKHHFNHCVMILNTSGHNIFANIKPRTYGLLISYIKEAILATDLAEHMAIKQSFDEAVQNKDIYWNEEPYCSLLRKNLMTFCDLASVAKPWPIHKKVVELVTKEFFAQGDRERLELNKEPNEMMDARRSDELPRLQIGWIDGVCWPLYSNFATLCNSFDGHLKRIKENRQNWSFLNEQLKQLKHNRDAGNQKKNQNEI